MNVSTLEWSITVGVAVVVILFDVAVVARRPHEPSVRECATYLAVYVGLAVAFGLWVTGYHGGQHGLEFFAGWLTEYTLSIDNLFVFIVIMASFGAPRRYQQEALLVGIVIALVFRAVFIAVGAVAISTFSWVFYLFGAFLVWTAWKLLRGGDDHDEHGENTVVRLARRRFRLSDRWDGLRLFVIEDGRRALTPMALVVLALGTTDLLFALDSIPAIFGLTSEPYLVLTANIFALMGLRQLYFLLGDLLQRLVFLSQGLAVLLAFIGVKLVLEALHDNSLPFVNGGKGLDVPVIPTYAGLLAIVLILGTTAVVSLVHARRHPERVGASGDDGA